MIFFTSDTHFFHKNILKFGSSSRSYKDIHHMNEVIIEKWNSQVRINDDVYHLGDFSFGSLEQTKSILARLNGKIHLIRGNHDSYKKIKDLGFYSIKEYDVVKYNKERIVVFHYPIEEWDRAHYGDIHLHGHCHGNLHRKLPNRFDIGWDVMERLVHIDEVLRWKTKHRVSHHGVTK